MGACTSQILVNGSCMHISRPSQHLHVSVMSGRSHIFLGVYWHCGEVMRFHLGGNSVTLNSYENDAQHFYKTLDYFIFRLKNLGMWSYAFTRNTNVLSC